MNYILCNGSGFVAHESRWLAAEGLYFSSKQSCLNFCMCIFDDNKGIIFNTPNFVYFGFYGNLHSFKDWHSCSCKLLYPTWWWALPSDLWKHGDNRFFPQNQCKLYHILKMHYTRTSIGEQYKLNNALTFLKLATV